MTTKAQALREHSWLARLDARLANEIAPATEDGTLQDEIGLLRIAVMEVMQETDVYERARALASLVTTIRQALLAQRLIQGDATDDVATSIATILTELGLAE